MRLWHLYAAAATALALWIVATLVDLWDGGAILISALSF
jgi:hypothetical protein